MVLIIMPRSPEQEIGSPGILTSIMDGVPLASRKDEAEMIAALRELAIQDEAGASHARAATADLLISYFQPTTSNS